MANTPAQERRRGHLETALRLGAPFLDLLLAAGDRLSRFVAPEGEDYYAIRPPGERIELGRFHASPHAPPARQPEA